MYSDKVVELGGRGSGSESYVAGRRGIVHCKQRVRMRSSGIRVYIGCATSKEIRVAGSRLLRAATRLT